MSIRLPFASAVIAAAITSASLHAADIHVNTRGRDGNPGTTAEPVATLQGAQKIVRQHIAKGLQKPVNVIIGGGTYYLNAPLALTSEDSGTAKCPITWRAAEGEKVLLSGGVRITGKWKKGEDGIWSVAIPDVEEGWNFRQLFVDGKRAIRARFLNADAANPFLYATGGDKDHGIIDPKLVKAGWEIAPDVQINVVAQWKFFNQWNTVTGVDPAKGRIDIADSEQHGTITKGNWFWIEGVKQELDQPGEWYLDRAEGQLYYMPEPGVDPNALVIVAPRLNVIIAHNYFTDLSRNGIFAFRNQGGNIVEYNHIHDAMRTTLDGACIHFATMNHLNAPNYILNNWLYDIWGYDQKPDGKPKRYLANGIFLDWDSSNMTVKDNYVYNAGGAPIKVIWHNWNVRNVGNTSSKTRIVPPFVDEVGPKGTATNGIDLETNRLNGSLIHYCDSKLVTRTGDWEKQTMGGQGGLFRFNVLKVALKKSAQISYTLPITEDGTYQISLLYKPDKANASNAKLSIHHAEGVAKVSWNMKNGNIRGFAVEIGKFPFRACKPAKIVISNEDANGTVVVDSVAYVRVSD